LETITPATIRRPFANYSHGIVVPAGSRLLFASGQLGITAEDHIPEDAGAQAELCFRALAEILRLPFTRNESGSYAWPTAYSENPTEDAWRDLVYSGLYSAEEVDTMKTQGTGYLGYRTAITPDGDWQFFVAGD